MSEEEINSIKNIMTKFNVKLESYELDKKTGQLSIDSVSHLFPSEIEVIKKYIEYLEQENKELKERIDNGIKLINVYIEDDCSEFQYMIEPKQLLEILKGDK